MNPDERRERASSFSTVAAAYERARPGYPDAAVTWLAGDGPHDVVDLGAGTGKLTRALVTLGHRVTAVDPLPEMLEQLRRALPTVTAVEGSAEAIPLPAASVDVVTVAQAFHWFDPVVALREIARVLRPEGRLALVWNTRDDRQEWVAKLSDTIVGHEAFRGGDVLEPIAASGLYGPVENATFAHRQRLDRVMLRELVLSRSYCAVLSEEDRRPALERVGNMFDAHAVDGAIELPYLTECFRTTRLPG